MSRMDNKNGIVQNKFTIGTTNPISIYSGVGIPNNNLGDDGDMYMSTNGDKYTKLGDRWHLMVRSYYGESTPSNSLGENGDFYKVISTDTSTATKYVKVDGEWTPLTAVVHSEDVPQDSWFTEYSTYTNPNNKRYSKISDSEWVEADVVSKTAKPADDMGTVGAIYTDLDTNILYVKDTNGEWKISPATKQASAIPDAGYGEPSDLFYQTSTGKYFSKVDAGSGVYNWVENTDVLKMGDIPFTNYAEDETLYNSVKSEYFYYNGTAWVQCAFVYTNFDVGESFEPDDNMGGIGDLCIIGANNYWLKTGNKTWVQITKYLTGEDNPAGSESTYTTLYTKTTNNYYYKLNDTWYTTSNIKTISDVPTATSGSNYDDYTLNFTNEAYYSLIPNMSSNSENEYELTASSENVSHKIFNAFNSTGFWCEDSAFSTNSTIIIKVPDAVILSKYKFTKQSGYAIPKSWTISTSFNGIDYTVVDTRENVTVWNGNNIEFEIPDNGFKYLKIEITAVDNTAGSILGLSNIVLYEGTFSHHIYKDPTNGWTEYGLERTANSIPLSTSGAVGNKYISVLNTYIKTADGWNTSVGDQDYTSVPTATDGLDDDIYNIIIEGVTTSYVKLSGIWYITSNYSYTTSPNEISTNGSSGDYYVIDNDGVITTYINVNINGVNTWINNTENSVYEESYDPDIELPGVLGDIWHNTVEDTWKYYDGTVWLDANKLFSSDIPETNYWTIGTIYNTGAGRYIKKTDGTWVAVSREFNSTGTPDTNYWATTIVYNNGTDEFYKQSSGTWLQINKIMCYDEAPDNSMWNNGECYVYDDNKYVKHDNVWTKITVYVNSLNAPLNNYWADNTLYRYNGSQNFKVSGAWWSIQSEEDNLGIFDSALIGTQGDFCQISNGVWYYNDGTNWVKVPNVIEQNLPPVYTSLANYTIYQLQNGSKYDILSNRSWYYVPTTNQFSAHGTPPANGSEDPGSIVAIVNTHTEAYIAPNMTSDERPYNKVTASSQVTGYEVWQAFNSSTGMWKSASGISSAEIVLEMTKVYNVWKFKFKKATGVGTPGTITIFGSYDNVNWMQLVQRSSITWGDADVVVTIPIASVSTYQYYKLQFTSLSSNQIGFSWIEYIVDKPEEYMRNPAGQWVKIENTHKFDEYSKPLDKDGGDLVFYMLPNSNGWYKRNYESGGTVINTWIATEELYKSSQVPVNVKIWTPGNLYQVNDFVTRETTCYRCLENHTAAATWNTEVVPGKPESAYWIEVVNPSTGNDNDIWFVVAADLYLKADGAWSKILTEADLSSNIKEAREQVFLFA